MPPLDRRVGQHLGIARFDFADRTHHVGVIGHSDPVERLSESHRLAAGRGDFLATGKPRRLFGAERRAAAPGVGRPRGVNMLVTEIRPLGIAPAGVRRVARLFVELRRIGGLGLARVGVHRAGAGGRPCQFHGRRLPRQACPGGVPRRRRPATLPQSRALPHGHLISSSVSP